MNIEGLEDDDAGVGIAKQFNHSARLQVLQRQIYGHVLAAIDFDKISGFEQLTAIILGKDGAMPDDLAFDLASVLIEGALRRVVDDPRRYLGFGPPPGITPEEAAAVAFDASCEYCVAEREYAEDCKRAAGSPRMGPPCECCDMLAADWREEHAEALAKAGLTRPKHEHVSSTMKPASKPGATPKPKPKVELS